MTFEQLEHQSREEKKKKSLEGQKREQFFLEKQILTESTHMLQKLAQEIAQEFGIDVTQAKELLSGKTENSLDALKGNLNFSEKDTEKKFEEAVKKAREILKNISKKKREVFRKSLEEDIFQPENHTYILTPLIFGNTLIERAKYPKTFTDQCIGAGIGLFDTTEAIILFTYALGKGILLTPYHIYLVLSGKAEYNSWKNI